MMRSGLWCARPGASCCSRRTVRIWHIPELPWSWRIRRAKYNLRLVKRTDRTYFDVLRAKLLWGRDPRGVGNGEEGTGAAGSDRRARQLLRAPSATQVRMPLI